jgi:hypothetical protein
MRGAVLVKRPCCKACVVSNDISNAIPEQADTPRRGVSLILR